MPISISNTTLTFNDATTMTTAATSPIPAGTVMLFYQNAAPTGWTIVTSQNNKALRVVSGSGGVAGGTTSFSSVFTNQTVSTSISVSGTTGGTTLSTAQLPSHSHPLRLNINSSIGQANQNNLVIAGDATFSIDNSFAQSGLTYSIATGSGSSHDHSFSGSGSGTSSAVTLNVQYIDIILCSKN
jgi:hypothetical protein